MIDTAMLSLVAKSLRLLGSRDVYQLHHQRIGEGGAPGRSRTSNDPGSGLTSFTPRLRLASLGLHQVVEDLVSDRRGGGLVDVVRCLTRLLDGAEKLLDALKQALLLRARHGA